MTKGGKINVNDDLLGPAAFLKVLVTLIVFFESNGDESIPITTLRTLLNHYDISNK